MISDDGPRYRDSDWSKGVRVRRRILGANYVHFTRHALERMKQRGVTQEEVFSVLKNPDETGLPTQPHRKRVRKARNEYKAVDVVYEKRTENALLIITVIVVTLKAIPERELRRAKRRKQRKRRK